MCDHSNSTTVVGELIKYLHRLNVSVTADYAIREEIVLKVAILAEKYASRYKWYVDVILQLVAMAGDAMSDAIWYRAIKLITNHEDIQEYATDTAFKAVCSDLANETTVKVASYLVGEYGTLIADMPNSAPIRQFEVLQSKYSTVTEPTKAILLSTYVKFCNMFPELKQRVMPIFKLQAQQIDPELQQRSVEYFNLLALNDDPLVRQYNFVLK
jgi:AP-2 complex subunit alpha